MNVRVRYLPLADILLAVAAAALSFALRFDTFVLWQWRQALVLFAALCALVRPATIHAFGLYKRVWRYASVREALLISAATGLGSIILGAVILGIAMPLGFVVSFPRSVILIEGILSLLLLGGVRFGLRALASGPATRGRRPDMGSPKHRPKRVLVIGAGDAGAMIVREMQAIPRLGFLPVGFVDDDAAKTGMRIHGVPILGERDDISTIVREKRITEVIIAIPSAPGQTIREMVAICKENGVPFRTIPGLHELIDGRVHASQLRDVQLDDLLRREPIAIDLHEVGKFLSSATVLVTGAGGSIGSELCRQSVRFQPKRLVLFELAENNLYRIHRELVGRFPTLDIVPVLGNIRDATKVGHVFSQQQPQVVFHAAAYKHVPLMECNVDEVVANNVMGTRNLLEASKRYGVSRFTLISTDKAVDPKSVMGTSKRIAERLVQEAARCDGSTFIVVRFGNVLGSSGSIVPLFKEQIVAGGPVTVTHPDVERYFMTIPEAVSLIIQAAAISKGDQIFVLDMGTPVKIKDLAADLIRLSGFEPGQDIEIVYTGLRPGEKLQEQLFTDEEQPQTTKHPQILVAHPERYDADKLGRDLAELETLIQAHDVPGIIAKLHDIVPAYQP